MVDITIFRAALPQFVSVPDASLQIYLDMATRRMAEFGDYGEGEDDAHIFLTAHLLSLAGFGPALQAGALVGFKNVKAGSVSLDRKDEAAMGQYPASQYGVLFWQIHNALGFGLIAGGAGTGFAVTGTGTMPIDPLVYPHGQG